MNRIIRAGALPGFRVALVFADGVEGQANLSDLAGRGVFAAWNQPGEFERVSIGSGGELVWASGIELCADALYMRVTGKTPEDIFPLLESGDRLA